VTRKLSVFLCAFFRAPSFNHPMIHEFEQLVEREEQIVDFSPLPLDRSIPIFFNSLRALLKGSGDIMICRPIVF
jgi:hypothetical protein